MALGTLASRLTGFVRTVIIATAIGKTVGDAYNTANTIPNTVYELLLGGVLTSVVVPLLVAAAHRDRDDGVAYAQRLLSLVVAALAVASGLAVVFAPEIVGLYHPVSAGLATTFARFFLPQIFFYGVGAMLTAILNVRGSFAAPMWAPVVNNVVVIATGVLFLTVTGSHPPAPANLSDSARLVLAVGTTTGIVAQTVALLPALRATRFRLRLRLDLRGAGLRRAAGLAGWVFAYVLVNQIAFVVITRLANGSGLPGAFSFYTYAFILVSLPYAVVAVTVVTALLPQMSRSAMAGRLDAVCADLARGLNLVGVLLVPAEFALIAFGPLIGTVVFAHLNLDLSGARLIGAILAGYAVSLVPFSAFQLQLRTFYALQDTRTPALVNLAVNAVNLAADVALYFMLPVRERVVGLAVGYSLSYLVGCAVFAVLLRRRIGTATREHVLRTHVRLTAASMLAAGLGYAVAHAITAVLGDGPGAATVALAVAALTGTWIYLMCVRRMRVPAVRAVLSFARARLGSDPGR